MKNKRLTYILIPLVLIVWGLIFYKIFTHMGNGDSVAVSLTTQKRSKGTLVKDTIAIKANYKDPFLKGNARPMNRQLGIGEISAYAMGFSKKKEPKPEILIPDMKYFGLIANSKNKQKIGLFRLNSKDLILKEGDLFEEFKIYRLFNDSVKVVYRKIKKTVKKNSNPS